MTVNDIKNLSYQELEDLMDGMNRNAQAEKEMIENGGEPAEQGTMQDLLDMAMSGDGSF